MTEEEFGKWYRSNMDVMLEAGIYHPNSEGGRWIKTALTAATRQYGPILDQMQNRINALESAIHGDKVKITPKQKLPEVKVEEVKVEETPKPTTKRKRRSVNREWSV